jgi:hypothetical protein
MGGTWRDSTTGLQRLWDGVDGMHGRSAQQVAEVVIAGLDVTVGPGIVPSLPGRAGLALLLWAVGGCGVDKAAQAHEGMLTQPGGFVTPRVGQRVVADHVAIPGPQHDPSLCVWRLYDHVPHDPKTSHRKPLPVQPNAHQLPSGSDDFAREVRSHAQIVARAYKRLSYCRELSMSR